MSDNVNHPSHYTSGGIECIDAIRASMTPKGFIDYCKGNVLKYIWRYRNKGGAMDLEKASVYLNWMIDATKKMESVEINPNISPEEIKEMVKHWDGRSPTPVFSAL